MRYLLRKIYESLQKTKSLQSTAKLYSFLVDNITPVAINNPLRFRKDIKTKHDN